MAKHDAPHDIGHELLQTFLLAARLGTFAAAAVASRKSVSAISQQVRTLEARLGVPLFERHGRRVRLAASGEALAARLSPVLAELGEVLTAVRDAHEVVQGRVRLAGPRTFSAHWLRPRLPALFEAHPELELDLTFGVPSLLERQLAEGTLDIAILGRAPELDIVVAEPIAVERFVLVASPGYLARHGQPATAAEHTGHRYLVFDDDLAMHAPYFRAAFGARAPPPQNIAGRIASLEEMLALVEGGVALAVLPDYAVAEAVQADRVRVIAPQRADRSNRPARAADNTLYLARRKSAVEPARVRVVLAALREPVTAAGSGSRTKRRRS